jgi:hypothetical protein
MGGALYVIGGNSLSAGYERANEIYDPTADTWSDGAPMPTRRGNLAAAVVDGTIYVIGGSSSATAYHTENEAYTPALYVYRKD